MLKIWASCSSHFLSLAFITYWLCKVDIWKVKLYYILNTKYTKIIQLTVTVLTVVQLKCYDQNTPGDRL